jgi:hypothetical protein
MNLHSIVSGAIGVVNPFVDGFIMQSTGYTQDANYNRIPQYTVHKASIQKQAATSEDLKVVDGQNVQGAVDKFYIQGNWNGVFQRREQGGDLIVIGDTSWLIIQSMEDWPDWCAVLGAEQAQQEMVAVNLANIMVGNADGSANNDVVITVGAATATAFTDAIASGAWAGVTVAI